MFKWQATLINYLNAVLLDYLSKIPLFSLKNIEKMCVHVIFKVLRRDQLIGISPT